MAISATYVLKETGNNLRRNLVMEESKAPQDWNAMFGNVENNFAPWKFSPDDRDKWAQEMNG